MTDVPTPELIFRTLTAYQETAALRAGIELDLFSAIAEGAQTIEALTEKTSASIRGIRSLCDALSILGFLRKEEDRYLLEPVSAMYLDKKSPAYFGGAAEFLGSPMLLESFGYLTEAVKKGGHAVDEHGSMAPEHDVWVSFARSMGNMAAPAAFALADILEERGIVPRRVLDVAAGHGFYGLAIAEKFSEARVDALDWENVLEVAEENARKLGVADRYRTLPGDARTADLEGGYDLILITNFLHHFDHAECVAICKRLRDAMTPNGVAITLEFVPDPNRISPPQPAFFSLVMLATTPSGDAYTYPELQAIFGEAGFGATEQVPLPKSMNQCLFSTL